MNLSSILNFNWILEYLNLIASALTLNIKKNIFRYLVLILTVHNNIDCLENIALQYLAFFETINFIIHCFVWKICYILLFYNKLCLTLTYVLSWFTLLYITIVDKSFKDKYPILYWVLVIVSVILILSISVVFFVDIIKLAWALKKNFILWINGEGSSGKGKAPAGSGPSGSGGSGGPGGSSGAASDNPNKRKRSVSETSSYSAHSSIFREDDDLDIKKKKFAGLVYDSMLYNNRNIKNFEESKLNPVNWEYNGSQENQEMGWYLVDKILKERKARLDVGNRSVSFRLKDINVFGSDPIGQRLSRNMGVSVHSLSNHTIFGRLILAEKFKNMFNN